MNRTKIDTVKIDIATIIKDKKSYSTPKLQMYGGVKTLTAGGSSIFKEKNHVNGGRT